MILQDFLPSVLKQTAYIQVAGGNDKFDRYDKWSVENHNGELLFLIDPSEPFEWEPNYWASEYAEFDFHGGDEVTISSDGKTAELEDLDFSKWKVGFYRSDGSVIDLNHSVV